MIMRADDRNLISGSLNSDLWIPMVLVPESIEFCEIHIGFYPTILVGLKRW